MHTKILINSVGGKADRMVEWNGFGRAFWNTYKCAIYALNDRHLTGCMINYIIDHTKHRRVGIKV